MAKKKGSKSFSDVTLDGTTRVVTPDNPLIINETVVTYESVEIQGGEIIAEVNTRATFNELIKTS